jgi:hypothetical protein
VVTVRSAVDRGRTRRASFITENRITPAFVDAWRDLSSRAAEPNPFAEPEIMLPAMRGLGLGSSAGLLVVGDENRLDAVLPVLRSVRVPVAGRVSLPVPVLQAWVEPYQVLSTPLLDAQEPVPAMAALLRPPPSWPAPALMLRYFREGGPVAAALDEALAARGQRALRLKTYERALVVREGGPAASRNRRNRYNRLRRQREAMERDLGPVRVVERTADPAAIEQFLELEAAGWKGAAGTALASDPAHVAWFREVCDGLRAAGKLEVLSLEAGDRVTAMWVDFDMGEGSLHFKSAYDETLGEYRPGEQLLMHCLDTAAAGRYAWRDSATVPDNTLFNQLWPSRVTLSTVAVPLHGRIGTVAVAAMGLAQRIRSRRQDSAGGPGH